VSLFGDRLDAAKNGDEFGKVVNDLFSYIEKLAWEEKDSEDE